MNFLDLIILVLVIGSVMRGYKIGLIRQAIQFFGFFIAFFVAFQYSKELVPWVKQIIPTPTFQQSSIRMFQETFQLEIMFYNAIAFFIIFLLTKLFLQIGGAILHQVASLPGITIVNQTLGASVGFIQIALLLIILVNIVSVMPFSQLNQWTEGSLLVQYIYQMTPMVTDQLYDLWNTSAGIIPLSV